MKKFLFVLFVMLFSSILLQASHEEATRKGFELSREEIAWLEAHPNITFSGDPHYLPYEGYDEKGNYVGIMANYLSYIEERLNIKFQKLPTTSWQDTIERSKKGEVDIITNYVNDSRESTTHKMTRAFLKSPVVIVKTKDKDKRFISDLNQLEGKKIGVVGGYSFKDPIVKKYVNLNFVYFDTIKDLFEAVATLKIDAALASINIASYTIMQNGFHNLQIAGRSDYYMELGFEIKNEHEILVGIFDKIFSSMTNQEHNNMTKEWVDLKIEKTPINYPLIIVFLLVGVFVPILFFYLNKRLKREVEKKTYELSTLLRFFDEHVISSKTDLDGNITQASSAFCRISGNSREYLMGKNHRISKHPANDQKVYEEMWKTIANGGVWKGRVINKKRDGGYYWVDSTIEPEYDIEGKKIGYISIRTDVTAEVELKKLTDNLEGMIEQRTHELSLLSSQNQAIFESATIGILLLKNRVIIKANSAICEMFGVKLEEILGSSTHFIYKNDEDYADIAEMYSIVKNGETASWEIELLRKNGELFWAKIHMRAINKDNIDDGVVATIEDISLERERFLEIEAAKKAAEDATKTKSAFLANMSHEIRTPMNAIIGMTHLALTSALDAKQKNYLQKIDTAAKNLLSIINDILDFSKIESGKMSFEEIDFNLEDVLENVSNLNILKIQNKGLELLFDMDAHLPTLLVGDPLRLEQVLTNLVSNAVKFTEKGEIKISLKLISKDEEHCELEFRVSDTGIGLTKEQMQKLFRAFSQADSSTTREYGGTGLGLTISKYLVERMDGEIWVESEYKEGSSFIFRAKLKLQKSQKDFDISKKNMEMLKVLVVDDNDAAREILESMLKSLKFDATSASSAEGAIEMLRVAQEEKKPFEIVLMDWMMPKMDGVEAIKRIREDLKLETLPTFIMVSAYDKDELMQKTANVKIDGFISKPTTPSTLFDTILGSSGLIKAPKADEYVSAKNNPQTLLEGAYILLVEDNLLNQEFAIEVLEKAGVLVDVANNGKEAYAMAKHTNYDGILMDCQMPVMDGYEATRLIRDSSDYPKVPILALSANAMEADKKLSLESGMNDHISKPIDVRVLFETMAKWIKPTRLRLNSDISKDSQKQSDKLNFTIDGLDLSGAFERAGGDNDFLKKMLGRFAQTQGAWIEGIDTLLAQDKIEDARRETHTLKGLAGNIGAAALFNLTKEVEEKLKNGELENAELLIPLAKEELELVIKNINNFFQNHIVVKKEQEPPHLLTHAEIENLKHKVKELVGLLDEFDSSAMGLAEEIAPEFVNLGYEKEAQEFMKNMSAYEFEEAKKILLEFKI